MEEEIIEIEEEEEEEEEKKTSSINGDHQDVYVAVGKHDLHVLKWVLDHLVCPGSRVFLLHIFASSPYIRTPVGSLAKSQLKTEQLRVYDNEEYKRRRKLLEKYISLCNDAKVTVDTILVESNTTAKAILGLIPVLNITKLVLGGRTKAPFFLRPMKRLGKGNVVKKNAPLHCQVTLVLQSSSSVLRSQDDVNISQGSCFHCGCFPAK